MLSKVLLVSPQYQVQAEALTIVACLSVPSPFLRPRDKIAQATDAHLKFRHPEGDHLTLLRVFQNYIANKEKSDWCNKNYLNGRSLRAASDIREQLNLILKKRGLIVADQEGAQPNHEAVRKCLLAGFFPQVGSLQRNGVYLTVKDSQIVTIHPSCSLQRKPQFVLYNELVLTKKNYMRIVSEIKGSWLFEVAPEYFDPDRIKQLDVKH